MTDTNNVRAGDSSVGNIFLFIMSVMAKHKAGVDEDIAMHYADAQMTDAQYKASVDKWKQDAALLPDAGFKEHHDAENNINGQGMSLMVGGGAVLAVLGAAILALSALAGMFLVFGIGALVLVIVATLIGVYELLKNNNNSSFSTPVAAYNEYDQNKQAAVSNKVQTDQTEVQKIQGNLNQIMQQYIGPANDLKTQDANMIQAAMQWYKAMMWTQGAA